MKTPRHLHNNKTTTKDKSIMAKRKQDEKQFPELGIVATVFFDPEWQEWSVVHRALANGKPTGEKLGEYFACDKADAEGHAASARVASYAVPRSVRLAEAA